MLFLEENTTQKICGDETEIRMEKGGVWDLENCVCIWYNQISCVFVCVWRIHSSYLVRYIIMMILLPLSFLLAWLMLFANKSEI